MRWIIFTISLLVCWSSVFAQHSGIYLVDSATQLPMQGVNTRNDKVGFYQTSDEYGFVSLERLPKEADILVLSGIGVKTKMLSLRTLDRQKSTLWTVALQSQIARLDEVTITNISKNGVFKTISELDIHLRPISNSQEVLRLVPGLFIGQHAGGGKAEQIFLRGFDLDHGTDINITADGVPVNMVSHAHGQGYADLHFLIPELVRHVNFNKGPYFADKGNFTTTGYADFQTKDFIEKNFIKLEGGLFNTWRAVTAINLLRPNAQRKNQSLYVAGEGFFTQGYFDHPQNFTRFNGMLKYHTAIQNKYMLSLTLSGFASQWDASGQIPQRLVDAKVIGFFGAVDTTEGGKTSRYNANVQLRTHLNNGASLDQQVYYSNYTFQLYSNFTFFKEDPINGDQIRQKEHRHLLGYQGAYTNILQWGKLRTEMKFGLQARYDMVDGLELTRTKNRIENITPLSLGDVRELNVASYYQQQFFFTEKFTTTAAIRLDYFNNFYDDHLLSEKKSADAYTFSPKLNLAYSVNEHIRFYLNNGGGFHSNDTRVVVKENGRTILPPAYGSDLGGVFKMGKNVLLHTAVWYLWLDQEFVYVGDEAIVEPSGQTQRWGVDISLRYQLYDHLYADIDVNFAHPRAMNVPSEQSYIPLAPLWTSTGGITYRKQTGINGSLRYRYMADRPADETNTHQATGYFIWDVLMNYTKPKWEVGIAIQNLFNTKWKETQFLTESQLKNEPSPISEIHFTAGTPFSLRLNFSFFF